MNMNTNTAPTATNVASLDAARYARSVKRQAKGFHETANTFPPSSVSYRFFRALARDDMVTAYALREAVMVEVEIWDDIRCA